ncbi:MAG: hypothetical protein JST66_05090 [Bacteroidetes bacterium]|nr:hypothetical protein [Bacteroidota bacterium]
MPEHILCVPGSFLERELLAEGLPHIPLGDRTSLIELLERTVFDVFVSNGCPHVLPISRLHRPGRKFINLHPSLLPDLRGKSAISGAFLFGRDAGATCHVMDDGIDTGGIIAQVRVPVTSDLDTGLLYQACWLAEREAFRLALARGFEPVGPGGKGEGTLYYSQHPDDPRIDWAMEREAVERRILAFGLPGKGAWFMHRGERVVVRDVRRITNPYLMAHIDRLAENEVLFTYEDKAVVRKGDRLLNLRDMDGAYAGIRAGDILGAPPA